MTGDIIDSVDITSNNLSLLLKDFIWTLQSCQTFENDWFFVINEIQSQHAFTSKKTEGNTIKLFTDIL